MSSIISTHVSLEAKDVNPTQDLQKSTFLYGRAFHKISDGGKYIIQSINNVAQSILSKCIYVVSFGRCNLDNLKSYLFLNQTVSKGNEAAFSNDLPARSAPPPPKVPPPPPMPTPGSLNRASFSNRSSIAKVQGSPFRDSIALETLNESPDVRSSNSSTQDFLQENENTLEVGANSRRSSLYESPNLELEEESNSNSNVSSPKKKKGIQEKIEKGKQVVGELLSGMQDNKLFQKMQKKAN